MTSTESPSLVTLPRGLQNVKRFGALLVRKANKESTFYNDDTEITSRPMLLQQTAD